MRKGDDDDNMETLRFREERGGLFKMEGQRAVLGISTMIAMRNEKRVQLASEMKIVTSCGALLLLLPR